MTPPTRAATARCRRCRKQFVPVKAGHVFCSTSCRHRKERMPGAAPVDDEQIERLFDPSRDPDARVEPGEWCAGMDEDRAELYAGDTLSARRRWYLELVRAGRT